MRILLLAYSCEPDLGSEPEIGWNWATGLSEHHDVHVIAHAHNRAGVLRALERQPTPRLQFHFPELPRFLDPWERVHPYKLLLARYTLWQVAAFVAARQLVRRLRFDVVHHATWGTVDGLTLGWALGAPFVWGPVGGAQTAPVRLRRYLGSDWKLELGRNLRVRAIPFNPWARLTVQRACVALAANYETMGTLKALGAADVRLMLPTAVAPAWAPAEFPRRQPRANAPRVVAWVGRFDARKAPLLAIEAFAQARRAYPHQLWMIGSGRELASAKALAERLGVADDVRFYGQLGREAVAQRLASADVFLFTSLRDTFAGAVLEAMAWGLPVVALNHHGVRLLPDEAIAKVPPASTDATRDQLAQAILALVQSDHLREQMGLAGWTDVRERHLWPHRVQAMNQLLAEVLHRGQPPPSLPDPSAA